MIASRTLRTLSVIALTALPLLAGPVANAPLGRLLRQADAVVVGTIRATSSSAGTAFFELSVLRSIQGPVRPESVITVALASQSSPAPNLVGRTGVWFLTQQSPGWTILPVMVGSFSLEQVFLPALSTSPAALSSGQAPEDKLTAEIGASAQDPTIGRQVGWLILSGALDDLSSSQLPGVWTQLASSSSMLGKSIGLSALIRSGSASSLANVRALQASSFTAEQQMYLARAICDYRGVDAAGVAALGALARDSTKEARACAAHSLRSIHTRPTLPFLASLLDDSSAELRYEAVAGIASYANGLPVQTPKNTASLQFLQPDAEASLASDETRKHFPTRDAFLLNEDLYVSYWKNWLNAH